MRPSISPMVTWGTTPGMVVEVTDTVPDPAAMDSPADRESAERALDLHGARAGHADDRCRARTRLHRLLHQLAGRGPARGRSDRRRAARSPAPSAAWSSPAPSRSRRRPKRRACDEVFRAAGFEWREAGCSMCLGMNPDIARSRASAAPRPRIATSRAARARAGAPTWSARRWRLLPRSRATSSTSGNGASDEAD